MTVAEEKLTLGKGSDFVEIRLKRQEQSDDTREADFRAIPKPQGQTETHYGHIEIGDQEGFGFVVRASDYGGVVFEDDTPTTPAGAMAALEKGLAGWFGEQGE